MSSRQWVAIGLFLLAVAFAAFWLGAYPTVMIPAFGVPTSIILHGLSLWQLRRTSRTEMVTPSSAAG